MSKFTGPLAVRFMGDGRWAQLTEPLVWEMDEKGSGITVVVPAGFTSDGATVPRIVWPFMPPWGSRTTRAAILHDYLLTFCTRPVADRQFHLALLALGVGEVRAGVIYTAVRSFGAAKNTWLCISDRLL